MEREFLKYLNEFQRKGSIEVLDTDSDIWDCDFAQYVLDRYSFDIIDNGYIVYNKEVTA